MNFSEVLLLIIAIAITVIAIKITFTFDINKYIENKQEKLKSKIKNYCPHAKFVEINWSIWIQSTFVSPSWTLSYYCDKCSLVRHVLDQSDEERRLELYMKNPDILIKEEKKYVKLLKKGWFL